MSVTYFELDAWPIKYEIEMRQLLLLKIIVHKEYDDPCLQVYEEMFKFEDEPIKANDILSLRRTHNLLLNCNDDKIRKMSAKDWRSFVKNAAPAKESFSPATSTMCIK